jgi:hypothetical protein
MVLWQPAIATSLILRGGSFGLTIPIYEDTSSGLYWRYIVFYYCQQPVMLHYSQQSGDMVVEAGTCESEQVAAGSIYGPGEEKLSAAQAVPRLTRDAAGDRGR